MSPERRYNEKEIDEIFRDAAKSQEAAQRQLSHSEGLTLAELQQIGEEAGITAEFIARSAAGVDQTDFPQPQTRFLGLPISVARTIDLPGPLSDEAWDRLVVGLRETFGANGQVRSDGSLREWKNGNLRALVEPTDSGHRLRLQTLKGSAQTGLIGGLALLAFGIISLTILMAKGDIVFAEILLPMLFCVAGLGVSGITALRLPRWISERSDQMEKMGQRAVVLVGEKFGTARHKDQASGSSDRDSSAEPTQTGPTREVPTVAEPSEVQSILSEQTDTETDTAEETRTKNRT